MKQPNKQRLLSTSLTLIAASFLMSACSEKATPTAPPPPPVSILEIKAENTPLIVEMIGETAGYRDTQVRARVGGILLHRTYTEGQTVKQGQVLFEIDPEPYKAALDNAKGVLAQAAAQREKTKADLDRIVPLFKENAVSKRDFDNAQAAFDTAVATQQSAQANVKDAELNLSYTKVTAPISGVTSKGTQSEGSLISANGESGLLTTITQFDPMYVNYSYSDVDKQKLDAAAKLGQLQLKEKNNQAKVKIKLADGSIYKFDGQRDFSDNRVDTKTGTVQARAIFPNPDGQLLPGQFARISLEFGEIKNVIMLPEQAILQQLSNNLVLTINDKNIVVPRPVKVGEISNGGKVLVSAGLKPGDKVIIEGLAKAKPGSAVNPTPYLAKASAVAAQAQ